jgi:hypothetical protein
MGFAHHDLRHGQPRSRPGLADEIAQPPPGPQHSRSAISRPLPVTGNPGRRRSRAATADHRRQRTALRLPPPLRRDRLHLRGAHSVNCGAPRARRCTNNRRYRQGQRCLSADADEKAAADKGLTYRTSCRGSHTHLHLGMTRARRLGRSRSSTSRARSSLIVRRRVGMRHHPLVGERIVPTILAIRARKRGA